MIYVKFSVSVKQNLQLTEKQPTLEAENFQQMNSAFKNRLTFKRRKINLHIQTMFPGFDFISSSRRLMLPPSFDLETENRLWRR